MHDDAQMVQEIAAGDIAAGQSFQQKLAEFSAIVDSSQDAIMGASLEGVITSWNPAAERLYGYAADEIVGQPLTRLLPDDRADEIGPLIARVRRGEPIASFDTVRRRKAGSLIDVSLTLSPIRGRGGQITGVSAIAREITERKRADERLRESEERYKRLAEACPDGIVMLDLDGRILYASRQMWEVLGFAGPEELLGRSILECVAESDRPRVVANMANVVEVGIRRNTEYTALRRDGTTVPVETCTSVIRDAHGRAKALLATARDMTDRKRTERELAEGKKAAEAANRAKSEFLANMSHEIRTPMTAILGFTDILLQDLTGEGDIECARIVKRNAEHLLKIINDILDLSRIEAGRIEIARRDCSPRRLVEEVVAMMKVRADARNLAFDLEIREDVPEFVHTDPVRLRQILINLMGNAVKFTDVGGVRVVVGRQRTQAGDVRLTFDVIDTGIGMSAEQMAGLFQPFCQADASTSRRFGGTGLGLAISRRLADMLGGEISVSSRPKEGSTFRLSVDAGPIDAAPGAGRPTRARLPDAERRYGGRALVAEDALDNQRLIARHLARAGVETSVVEDGQLAVDQALAALEAGCPFDVILLDIQMPIMDGYEAARRLRAAGYRKPIIALTANAMTEDRQKCLDAGCDSYLSKPVDRRALLDLLAAILPEEPDTASQARPGEAPCVLHATP